MEKKLILVMYSLMIFFNFYSFVLSECCPSIYLENFNLNLLSDGAFCNYIFKTFKISDNGTQIIYDPREYVCYDGLKPSFEYMNRRCGKGDCNLFGCNCDNGCRISPDVSPTCSPFLANKTAIINALVNWDQMRQCAIYQQAREKTPCLGARFGSPCINPGFCDKPKTCESAIAQYDTFIQVCGVASVSAATLSIITAGLTMPVNFIAGGVCTTWIAEAKYLKDKYCSGARIVF
jgi:hypothetical protein